MNLIKNALAKDEEARTKGDPIGLGYDIRQQSILANEIGQQDIDLSTIDRLTMKEEENKGFDNTDDVEVIDKGDGVVEMIEKVQSGSDNEESSDEAMEVQQEDVSTKKDMDDASDSEEETTIILKGSEINSGKKSNLKSKKK